MGYEKGLIRSDRGLFIDKGNHWYDPRHPDFDRGADDGGSRDSWRAFSLCDAHASGESAGCFAGPGTYHFGSDVTLSADWTLARGAVIRPASGVTVTFSGDVRGEGTQAATFDTSLGGTITAADSSFGIDKGAGAPTSASYITLATDATLTNERVLTAGTGISITDGGAGTTVTIDHDLQAGSGISIVGDTISATSSFDPIMSSLFS